MTTVPLTRQFNPVVAVVLPPLEFGIRIAALQRSGIMVGRILPPQSTIGRGGKFNFRSRTNRLRAFLGMSGAHSRLAC